MKIDINKAKEGQQIAQEAIEALRNIDTEIENYPALKKCMEENEYADIFFQHISNYENYRNNNENKRGNIERLMIGLNNAKQKKPSRRIVLKRIISIAAALIAISLLIWYTNSDKHDTEEMVSTNNLITSPTLILSNGSNLDLSNHGDEINSREFIVNEETENDSVKYNRIVIPNKFTFKVTLEDGTVVMMNSNSELIYPEKFSGDVREIFLTGEAYFDVTKGVKPFIVNTSNIIVRVYGTKFNVNSTQAVLISGSVGITVKDGISKETMIKPNEMFSYDKESHEVTIKEVLTDDYTAWTEGYFKCTSAPLSELMKKIEQWYGVQFKSSKEEYKNINVTISLNNQLDIDNLLLIIENVTDVKFTKTDRLKYDIE